MPISWNEIRHNAIRFSREWAGAKSETAEKQTFWNEFFEVFGIRRRVVASFEEPVRKLSGDYGFIDLFWPGMLIVEHKSRGKDLGAAESQAFGYVRHLVSEGRSDEVPRYIIVSDFARIALYDLEPEEQLDLPLFSGIRFRLLEFSLIELHQRIHAFAFIPGYKKHHFEDQDPINLKAVDIMGRLHDTLEAGGYRGHDLERFLVRILFCLFAEDTGIFERELFHLFIEDRTKPDGSDLGAQLERLSGVLNTPAESRQKNIEETLASFPYVNGDLFAERLGFADFNRDMRNALLACTRFDWSTISPAIFGSLFQAVMEPGERRQVGGHYTSERDILKVIRDLFLDELREDYQRIGKNKAGLRRFQQKLATLRFLDPACGCGNFLVIAYRELRLLELDVLREIIGGDQQHLGGIQNLSQLDVDAFYGIEIGEWPARIAEVAMWLMDHQMNIRLSEAFGQYFVRLPLRKSPTIKCGNALRLDWKEILPPERCSYVLGNPPFVGHHLQTREQKADQLAILSNIKAAGVLDYVSNWYVRAAEYIQQTRITVAYVSTNSLTQGEQVGILWAELFSRYHLKIHFAHRTFKWQSEARGRAHVHVVIVGFGAFDIDKKRIFDYEADPDHPMVIKPQNISPYLIEAKDTVLINRKKPLCNVPEMRYGNKPTDGGHFILSEEESNDILRKEPDSGKFIRPYLGAQEVMDGTQRWCLWLVDIKPTELRELTEIAMRVKAVRKFRSESKAETTREYARFPTLFRQIAQPDTDFIVIPAHTSETRRYIPFAYFSSKAIVSNACFLLPHASHYHFGIISSAMHMAWVRQVCGRLKSDFRYSKDIVYNNFPWPDDPSARHRTAVDAAAQSVLDVRAEHQTRGATLADLYAPLAMPPNLVKAHALLDKAVDLCYRPQPFTSERQRVEYLFELYEKLTAPLTSAATPLARKRRAPKPQKG